MHTLISLFLLFPSAFAGGSDSDSIFKALESLSEKSVITNYFLSNPDSTLCGKGKSFSGLGQKLALATEEFKAVWSDFAPSQKQLMKLKSLAESCSSKDNCFSLRTLIELRPSSYKNLTIKENPEVDYSAQIKKIKNVCQKLDF